ncbi:hypothetical protein Psch_00020 [Pelotomaculum schinkii]|uniref:Uncharacterized protein n=1 Tax=Pelotomaculum schinkii TaxID=78350 RepID=A0A4Y7RBU5_9FIRM|nr:hypothetical protein Psch_00020 [Pelotomaculum schinkii]
MCKNEVTEYISIVLSQLNCSESKKIVSRLLYSEVCDIINKQNYDSSEEKIVTSLSRKLGDPKTLGQYFVWLENIMDLH